MLIAGVGEKPFSVSAGEGYIPKLEGSPMSFFSETVLLFLVIDPIGNLPLFLCFLKKMEPARRRRIIVRELFIALAILLLFLFAGRYMLYFLGISRPSISMSGGIILFLIAIQMIFKGTENLFSASENEEPFIVPLAVPLMAGPSALTTIVLLTAREPHRLLEWTGSLVAAWLLAAVILVCSEKISTVLGARGLAAVERLMGMLLTTVAVEMFVKGLEMLLHP